MKRTKCGNKKIQNRDIVETKKDYYPNFLKYGTKLGCYSSKNPNPQNLPRDDKRVKSVIISPADRRLFSDEDKDLFFDPFDF